MRTRGRVYQEPRLSESERAQIEYCPRGCGTFVTEERQRGANGKWVEVLFCLNEACGWREWTVEDICRDVEQLAQQGHRPSEIARHLGISERSVFRRLAEQRR
ncbi:MAG: helix-turn-helix domain-containing protein [Dehalococcoidia bacterium]|jgi:hypothetical protein